MKRILTKGFIIGHAPRRNRELVMGTNKVGEGIITAAESIINVAGGKGVDVIMLESRGLPRSRGYFSGAFPVRSAMWLTVPV